MPEPLMGPGRPAEKATCLTAACHHGAHERERTMRYQGGLPYGAVRVPRGQQLQHNTMYYDMHNDPRQQRGKNMFLLLMMLVMWESTGHRMVAIQNQERMRLRQRNRAAAAAATSGQAGTSGTEPDDHVPPVIVNNMGGVDMATASNHEIVQACTRHGLRPRPWVTGGPADGGHRVQRRPRVFDLVLLASPSLELLELRILELAASVDVFVVVEDTYNSAAGAGGGHHKPVWPPPHGPLPELADKVRYYLIPPDAYTQPDGQPPRASAVPGLQRSEMRRALQAAGAGPGDIVLTGNTEEIPKRSILGLFIGCEGWPRPSNQPPPPPNATAFPAVVGLEMETFVFSYEFGTKSTSAVARVGEIPAEVGGAAVAAAATAEGALPQLTPAMLAELLDRRVRPNGRVVIADAGWLCYCCFSTLSPYVIKSTCMTEIYLSI